MSDADAGRKALNAHFLKEETVSQSRVPMTVAEYSSGSFFKITLEFARCSSSLAKQKCSETF